MSDTWSIPGTTFVLVYIVLLALAWFIGSALIRSLDRRVARVDGEGPAADATVEDLALLAGGPVRVVQAAVARLLDAGVLRMSRDRRLATTGRAPVGDLDEEVVYAVETLAAPTPLSVMAKFRDSRAIRDLLVAAQRRGLLHDPAAVRRRRTLALVLVGAVVVLGLARLAAGIARGAPIGFLVVLVVVGAVLAVRRAMVSTRRTTRRGRATLAAARAEAERVRATRAPAAWAAAGAPADGVARGPVLAGALGVAGLVAVGGFAMYPDNEVAGLLAGPNGVTGGGGGDGGSSSDSSSGSSGGGGSSCGGGGCGG